MISQGVLGLSMYLIELNYITYQGEMLWFH
jgi:hypothetical protein